MFGDSLTSGRTTAALILAICLLADLTPTVLAETPSAGSTVQRYETAGGTIYVGLLDTVERVQGASAGDVSAELQQVANRQAELVAALRQLQDAYCRAAMLDEALAVREQIRRIEAESARLPRPIAIAPDRDPRTMLYPSLAPYPEKNAADNGVFREPSEVANQPGKSYFAKVTGAVEGSVWGVNPYTTDSNLAAAAVHAGVLKPGETKIVSYEILPGAASYGGSVRNDVTTSRWDSYPSSFRILAAAVPAEDVNLSSYRGKESERLLVFVIGAKDGTVWGDGIYTDDSHLGTAAVHAGLATPDQPAIVEVEILPGLEAYEGESRNGVTTRSYADWQGSFRLRSVRPRVVSVNVGSGSARIIIRGDEEPLLGLPDGL